MVEKVIFSLLGLGVHRSTGFSDIICSPTIFPFFQSRSTCQRDGLVMAPFAAKKRGPNASSGSYQTPEAKRTKISRRESKGRSVMPATAHFPLITKYFVEVEEMSLLISRTKSTASLGTN